MMNGFVVSNRASGTCERRLKLGVDSYSCKVVKIHFRQNITGCRLDLPTIGSSSLDRNEEA